MCNISYELNIFLMELGSFRYKNSSIFLLTICVMILLILLLNNFSLDSNYFNYSLQWATNIVFVEFRLLKLMKNDLLAVHKYYSIFFGRLKFSASSALKIKHSYTMMWLISKQVIYLNFNGYSVLCLIILFLFDIILCIVALIHFPIYSCFSLHNKIHFICVSYIK